MIVSLITRGVSILLGLVRSRKSSFQNWIKVFFMNSDALCMKKKHKTLKDLERILAHALLMIQELKPRVCDRCQGRINKPAHRFKLLLIKGREGAEDIDDKVR